jgi:hypothetical protein
MTMRAEAARAGNWLKHAVTALSVVGYEAGRRDLYRSLASMTDVELQDIIAGWETRILVMSITITGNGLTSK